MAGAVERIKPVFWMGSSRADLKTFPEPVQSDVGYALFAAQRGEEYRSVKSLKGFGGRDVLEIVVPHDGNAYRAVYTVRFEDSIYVLHAFEKKTRKTSSHDVQIGRDRFRVLEKLRQRHGKEEAR